MIVDDEQFHRDDFTVVLQPFMENIEAPRKVMIEKIHLNHTYISFLTKEWPFNNYNFAGKWKN